MWPSFTVVMVDQSEWLLAKLTPVSRTFVKVGRALRRNRGGAQAVDHEHDDVLLRGGGQRSEEGGEQQACAEQFRHGRLLAWSRAGYHRIMTTNVQRTKRR